MTTDPTTRWRFYRLAMWAFAAAILALWLPLSWQSNPNAQGRHVDVDFGVLAPLRATWESSPNGFWFVFTDLRWGAFALSAVLTVAALIAAREMYRKSRTTPPTPVLT